jgi:hypothetical protein
MPLPPPLPLPIIPIAALFVGLTYLLLKADGLALFAPKRTRRMNRAAEGFCTDRCRTPDGRCPLLEVSEQREACPLWRFINADVSTIEYGSPFAELEQP